MCHTCVGVRVGVKKRARKEHTSKITHIGHCIAAQGNQNVLEVPPLLRLVYFTYDRRDFGMCIMSSF